MTGEQGQRIGRIERLKQKGTLFNYQYKQQKGGIRELKIPDVYGKRQTSDSSWEFLKIENEQIKTAKNNSYG